MIKQEDLVGSWHLRSWTISYADGAELSYPFGEQPQGLLVYTADGWMSAAINRSDRETFPANVSPRKMPETALAQAYRSYFHYAGRYRVAGGDVIHSVTQSLNPNFVGSEQLRHAALEGDRLVLSGVDQAGTQRRHELVWVRA